MTLRRAALYVGGASLLVAWFSSAASVSLQRPDGTVATSGHTDPAPDALALDIEAQAKRLRERLASAPPPQQPFRNPFAFRIAERPARLQASPAVHPAAPAVPELPSEPLLLLVGTAEQKRPQGLVRTAMITTADDDLIMAAVGDAVLDRYRVTAIGHDTAELTDLTSGQVRRISLQ